ncbi:MAG: phospholipid carrier-dependent glycosyltransferase [Candidatus Acidiferrales bacterium]
MLDSSAVNETHENESPRGRWTAPLSAAAVAICLFGHLGAIGLTGPDEVRYAWIARAMAETGDWVTPRLWGLPWLEKPILYYWAAAVGFLLHLPAEWAARLPSSIAALAAALAIGWLAKKHYGGEMDSVSSPVLLAPLIFATSVGAVGFARAATPDMLFSASLTLGMACAAMVLRVRGALRAADRERSPDSRADVVPLTLFGAFLGLGVLAKGPAAIILAGGAIGIWALATKNWRAAIRFAHPAAIGAFCTVAIPWYAICAADNRDFLRVFLWQHNVERYATPLFQHRQPFWYFAPIALIALLPWTVLLWPAAQEGLRLRREKSWSGSPGFFFACWALWPILFFSFSQSKLPGYILPAIPPMALLCAIALARKISENALRIRVLLLAVGATWLAICIAAAFSGSRGMEPRRLEYVDFGRLAMSPGLFGAMVALAVAAILIVAALRARPATAILLGAVLAAGAVETVNLKILPALDPALSARPHAEFMRNDQHPDRIFTYELRRDWDYGLTFYFRRELAEWTPSDPGPALVLTTAQGLDEIQKLGRVSGDVEQERAGLVYVPITPARVSR